MRLMMSAALCTVLFACGRDASAGTEPAPPVAEGQKVAVFAGGCFWCVEKDFEKLDGVIAAESGYTGGKEEAPTYEDVGYHRTSHLEAVRVVYDPDKIDYPTLLDYFWHSIDPTQANGQFCDKGEQYRSAIFTSDKDEVKLAKATKKQVAEQLGATVDTRVLPEAVFWLAEDYHQDFYKKNPEHYLRYRLGCGRDARLQKLWGPKAQH